MIFSISPCTSNTDAKLAFNTKPLTLQPSISRVLTNQPAVVPAEVEEQLLFWMDFCGSAEEKFPIGWVGH